MFWDNLIKLCNDAGVSPNGVCNDLGLSNATATKWKSGAIPRNSTLKKIADYFGVTVDYLLGRESVVSKDSSEKKGFKVPVLGYVAAGIPIEEIADVLDYEELDANEFNPNYTYFGLKIKGDSMMPRIQRGDVVIVRQQPDVESGEIAIVRVNGNEATCKQVKKHDDGISLVSLNQAYDPMFFTWKDVENTPVSIIGKVVELRGKF